MTTWDLRGLLDRHGSAIISSDGYEVGKLSEVVYDYETESPLWLVAKPHGVLPAHRYLVPAKDASEKDGEIWAAQTAEVIHHEPPADLGEGFSSLGDQRQLYEYFGLPFDEKDDVRVLRSIRDLPGINRNW